MATCLSPNCGMSQKPATTRRRFLATTSDNKQEGPASSLKETLDRLKNENTGSSSSSEPKDGSDTKESSSSSSTASFDFQAWQIQAADTWDSFRAEVSSAWQDMVQSNERKSINKKIHPTETEGGDAPYTGPVELMIIDPSEQLTAWERMQKRLTEAPIIQQMLERSEQIYQQAGGDKVKKQVDTLREDAREAWETSQNPWVYRISSVYETMTADSPETLAVAELKKLDPEFTLEDWRRDVVEHTLPIIMRWFLEGRINQLKPWLGEGVFKRLAAEMKAREQEGTQIDTHVLGIMNSEILAIEPDEVEKGSPIILLHFMCQQINCVRRKKDGEIVEGSEDDIKANSYVAAFQREYDESRGELNWKIVDFRFNGAIAYL